MIELRAGRLRCELEPDAGGAVAGLWLDGMPLLHGGGCRPLVPFANRIDHAAVVWQGTQQPQVHHPGDAPRTIQGLAWQSPWEVLDADGASAMLAYEHRADAAWPFAFDCSQTLRLQPTGLELTLALTNQSPQAAPAGLGWRAALSLRPGSHVRAKAQALRELDAEHLPGRRRADTGLDADLDASPLERCYEGWDGLLRLHDAGGALQLRSELTRLLLWTAPGGDCLVAQPVSHAPNAVHLYAAGAAAADLGLVLLQPGESLLAQMRLEPAGAA